MGGRSQASIRRHCDPATASTGDHDPEEGVGRRLGEVVRGELESPLGDVGEVARSAGVEHRAGQVGVAAARRGRSGRASARATKGVAIRRDRDAADVRLERSGARLRKADRSSEPATAAPTGSTIAAPTSAPKRPAAEDERGDHAGGEEGTDRAPRRVTRRRSRRKR